MGRMKNEIGNTHGRLTVVSQAPSLNGKAAWLCRCSCGNSKIVTGDCLRTGRVASCGCYRIECYGKNSTTHGMARTPTYRSWQEMRVRCNDPTAISFPNYGARGIKVCERWNKFENFLADMGVRPHGTSLDRKNGNKGYYKGNCQWATRLEQNRNRRGNVLIRYNRSTKCLAEWCEELALPYQRMYKRIVTNNWPPKRAFETPFITHIGRLRVPGIQGSARPVI